MPNPKFYGDEVALKSEITALDSRFILASTKGVATGVAELDSAGKVPTSQLPSFVDDVIEGYYHDGKFYKDEAHTQEITPETGKIYVDIPNNTTYRWSGTAYVQIKGDLALGETSTTAYRGDRGKTAYDHSQVTTGNPHGVTKADVGLGNCDNTSDADKPVSTATQTELNKKVDKAWTESDKGKMLTISTASPYNVVATAVPTIPFYSTTATPSTGKTLPLFAGEGGIIKCQSGTKVLECAVYQANVQPVADNTDGEIAITGSSSGYAVSGTGTGTYAIIMIGQIGEIPTP